MRSNPSLLSDRTGHHRNVITGGVHQLGAGAPLLSARWLPGSAGLRVKFPWRLQLGAACWLAEDAILRGKPAVLAGHRQGGSSS